MAELSSTNIYGDLHVTGDFQAEHFLDDTGNVMGGNAAVNSTAVGLGASASASDFGPSTAIGRNATADKLGTAIGEDSEATNWTAVAVGYNASTTGDSGVSIGGNAKALAGNAIAVGQNSNATAGNTIAIGSNVEATHVRSVAIGHGAVAAAAGEGVLGGSNTFNHVHAWRIPGSLKVEGDFTTESGVILKAPNGGLWRVTVANDGALVTTAV